MGKRLIEWQQLDVRQFYCKQYSSTRMNCELFKTQLCNEVLKFDELFK